MTELFGRLAPGVTLDQARADLRAAYAAMVKDHPGDYSKNRDSQISAVLLRDQITSRARTVLLVLLAASALVFVIAVSNVANLILARSVRREGELAIRSALGATSAALRRTLLAESLLLCFAGALLGVLSARPMVAILARYASRFSVRALDLTVDSSMLWVGAVLAVVASVLLAFVPRLPSADGSSGIALSSGSMRITGSASRRQRIFAVTQIAASFVLLAGASMLVKTLLSLQSAQTGMDMRHVLTLDVPAMTEGRTPAQIVDFYKETMRRINELPGVDRVAFGIAVPWRDAGIFGPGFQFTAHGHVRAPGEEDPRAQPRTISPGFFASLGVPILAGRDFNDSDRRGAERVVIVSQSVAQRMFPGQDAVNRHVMWTDPVMKFIPGFSTEPQRIIGVTADIDDEHVVPGPTLTVYQAFDQAPIFGGRLFAHTHANPYPLVAPITRIIRDMAANQPVERASTLEDVRAEVLTPNRLNTSVFGGFAAVALAIAVVGVAGVLAFSVSGRTREFGIRLALGAGGTHVVKMVVGQWVRLSAIGLAIGIAGAVALTRLMTTMLFEVKPTEPGVFLLVAGALMTVAFVASLIPSLRAIRIHPSVALRYE
jgi:predicted permease